jgi:hypothetical protein
MSDNINTPTETQTSIWKPRFTYSAEKRAKIDKQINALELGANRAWADAFNSDLSYKERVAALEIHKAAEAAASDLYQRLNYSDEHIADRKDLTSEEVNEVLIYAINDLHLTVRRTRQELRESSADSLAKIARISFLESEITRLQSLDTDALIDELGLAS